MPADKTSVRELSMVQESNRKCVVAQHGVEDIKLCVLVWGGKGIPKALERSFFVSITQLWLNRSPSITILPRYHVWTD